MWAENLKDDITLSAGLGLDVRGVWTQVERVEP